MFWTGTLVILRHSLDMVGSSVGSSDGYPDEDNNSGERWVGSYRLTAAFKKLCSHNLQYL
jgi:hypothetical protein